MNLTKALFIPNNRMHHGLMCVLFKILDISRFINAIYVRDMDIYVRAFE